MPAKPIVEMKVIAIASRTGRRFRAGLDDLGPACFLVAACIVATIAPSSSVNSLWSSLPDDAIAKTRASVISIHSPFIATALKSAAVKFALGVDVLTFLEMLGLPLRKLRPKKQG